MKMKSVLQIKQFYFYLLTVAFHFPKNDRMLDYLKQAPEYLSRIAKHFQKKNQSKLMLLAVTYCTHSCMLMCFNLLIFHTHLFDSDYIEPN